MKMRPLRRPPPSPSPSLSSSPSSPSSHRRRSAFPPTAAAMKTAAMLITSFFSPYSSSSSTNVFAVVAAAARTVYYDDQPSVRWTVPAAVTSLGSGNAVSFTPDGAMVLITSSEGTLRAVNADAGAEGGGYTVSVQPLEGGYTMRCASGVAFASRVATTTTTKTTTTKTTSSEGGTGESDGGAGGGNVAEAQRSAATAAAGGYYVYAVIDVPPVGSGRPETSRVIAFNHPKRSSFPRWISPSITGAVSGTPTVSSDGKYVFLTHNALGVGSYPPLGQFSVLSDDRFGDVIFTQTSGGVGTPDPWAPAGIVHRPVEGNYLGGRSNSNDLVAWGHLPGGSPYEGYVHSFQLPVDFDGSPDASNPLDIKTLSDPSWSTDSAPVFSSDGYTLIFSVSRSRLRGWTSGRRFDDSTNFAADMERIDESDQSSSPHSPSLSVDERTVYAGTTIGKVYAFANNPSADKIWERELGSTVAGTPVSSPDGTRVYVVESANGTAHGLSADDGSVLWTHDLADDDGAGGKESVSAYAISPDGSILVRGFVDGTVVALTLGKAEPTPSPVPVSGLKPLPSPSGGTTTPPSSPSTQQRSPNPTSSPAPAASVPSPPTVSPGPTEAWDMSAPPAPSSPRPTGFWETLPPGPPSSPAVSPGPTFWWERNPAAPFASSPSATTGDGNGAPTPPTVSPSPTFTPNLATGGPIASAGTRASGSSRFSVLRVDTFIMAAVAIACAFVAVPVTEWGWG